MANKVSNNLLDLITQKVIDFANDEFIAILMQSGFNFDPDTHDEYADVSASELGTGNGYTAGAKVLTGVTITRDDANNWVTVTWNNPSWTASGGAIGPVCGLIVFDNTVANDPVICFIDFGSDYTQADGGSAAVSGVGVRIKGV